MHCIHAKNKVVLNSHNPNQSYSRSVLRVKKDDANLLNIYLNACAFAAQLHRKLEGFFQGFLRRTLVLYTHVSNTLCSFAYRSSGPEFVSSEASFVLEMQCSNISGFDKNTSYFCYCPNEADRAIVKFVSPQ